MKKVLFATSALVAFAGAASAEVAVTGDAKLGMRYDSNAACVANLNGCSAEGTDSAWNVVNRARVIFTMTGQSDSGLEFGAKLRADQSSAASAGAAGSAYNGQVWVSGSYGKLTAGDIDSAAVNAVGHLPEIGVSGLDFLNEFWYTNSDLDTDQYKEAGLLYEYAINGVKLYASFMDQTSLQTANDRDNNAYSLGAAYEMAGWQVGLGYERSALYADPLNPGVYGYGRDVNGDGENDLYSFNNNTIALSASGAFNEVKVKAIYARTSVTVPGVDNDFKATQFGLGAEYKLANGVGLAGYYRYVKSGSAFLSGNSGKANILGLGASYDLGGGATLKGGIAHVAGKDGYDGQDRTMADFGLAFKF